MRLVFAVLILFIAYVASYPSFRDSATDNDENDAELELRAILNELDEEQMTRSLTSEEDDDEENDVESTFSKRQGGHNVVDKQSECEIKCIYTQRNPKRGKGKSVKDAAKACKQICPNPKKLDSKRKRKPIVQRKGTPLHTKLSLREFNDDNDVESQSNEESEEFDRRELYNYLVEQLQQNNDQ